MICSSIIDELFLLFGENIQKNVINVSSDSNGTSVDFELSYNFWISNPNSRACLRDIKCKIEANEALNITWLWTVKVAILIGFSPPKRPKFDCCCISTNQIYF